MIHLFIMKCLTLDFWSCNVLKNVEDVKLILSRTIWSFEDIDQNQIYQSDQNHENVKKNYIWMVFIHNHAFVVFWTFICKGSSATL